MSSHRSKLPEIDLHDWMIQFWPTWVQLDTIASYVMSVEISCTPVSQDASPVAPIRFAQDFLTSAHMVFAVRSARIPNIDSARASKSVIESDAASKHSVVSFVHAWRISSSFAVWASFICANASSTKASQTVSAMFSQCSVADLRNFLRSFKNVMNFPELFADVHVWFTPGRVIILSKSAKFTLRNAAPVVGSIYRPVISKHFSIFAPQTVVSVSISNIFLLHVSKSSAFRV